MSCLKNRNFWPYFAGNLLSNCGTWFQNIAQAILVYRLTHSTFLVGVVNFAQFVGVFLLAPWAGSAADRFDRRRLLVVTQLVAIHASTQDRELRVPLWFDQCRRGIRTVRHPGASEQNRPNLCGWICSLARDGLRRW